MERITIQYEKSSTQHGIVYLHGWKQPWSGWTGAIWINANLRRYDAKLPDLVDGDYIAFDCEPQGRSGPFMTVLVMGPIEIVESKKP